MSYVHVVPISVSVQFTSLRLQVAYHWTGWLLVIATAGENNCRMIDSRRRTVRGGRVVIATPTVRRVALF